MNLSPAEVRFRIDTEIFRDLSSVADRLGLECYVIGGFVRDMFLGRPSKDIDIVVVGSGIEIARAACGQWGKGARLAVFRNFGTAQVKYGGFEIEFVGARRESYAHDSRKPTVENGSLEDDQLRRDFTINVLALCLNAERFGELSDPFGGLDDLRDKIIRTPLDPDSTFSDDPLRMLRCVRFAAQLGFHIDDEAFSALERNAERIAIVSCERITDELNKIIMVSVPSKGFVDLQRSGLLEHFLPELSALDIVESHGKASHKNNFYHTLEVLDNVAAKGGGLWLRWAALLHDVGKTSTKRWDALNGWTFHNHNAASRRMTGTVFRRLKLPLGETVRYVEKLVDLHMRPIAIADDEVTDSAVRRLLFDAGDDIDDLMLLCEADVTSRNRQRKRAFLDNFKLVRRKLKDIEEKDRIRNFQPPVRGEEIMELFGLPPCKEVGELKSRIKDAILDGIIPNEYESAFSYMLKCAGEMGLRQVKKNAGLAGKALALALLVALPGTGAMAQHSRSFVEHIRTVETVADGDRSLPPVISLDSDDKVSVSFDDMTHEYVRYLYKLEHCDRDWNTTESLFESDYMTGTNLEVPIENHVQSMNTTVQYTHYTLEFPNSYVRPLLSGNYRVTIYEDGGAESPVAEACFSVVDAKMGVGATVTTNTDIDYNGSHQQVGVSLNFGDVEVRDPEREIFVQVLQNKRYDNAVIAPSADYRDANGLRWEHCRELIFDAGNEYRKFEVLNLHQPTMGVDILRWFPPYYHAVLYVGEKRGNYVNSPEQNGSYVIRNEANADNDWQSEYVITHFSLAMPELAGGDFYVCGQWTGYDFAPEYKMRYDAQQQEYVVEILMKQGYYNYLYLFVPDSGRTGSAQEAEGSFYQTENEYTVLVYAHLQGERYDRLLGCRDFRFIPDK